MSTSPTVAALLKLVRNEYPPSMDLATIAKTFGSTLSEPLSVEEADALDRLSHVVEVPTRVSDDLA